VLDETQQRALNALLGLPESDLWLEFVDSNGLCGLCGNYGVVFTSGLRSPAGVPCSVRKFCICPNGRAWKAQAADINRLPDWSGRSILRSGL